LAALVYNALTGRRFSSERDALQLPAPFATLVRAGAGSNGSLAAMRRALSGPAVTNTGTPAAGAVPAASASVTAAVPRAAATPRPSLKDELDSRPRKRPGVTIAAIVIMAILLVVFWYAFKRPTRHAPISGEAASIGSQPQAAPATPAAVPPAASPVGDAASAMGAPETVKPAPRPSPTKAATDATPASGDRSVWHVVVYTYNRETAAQRKATELAAKYPQLEPQVFSPTGQAPYLVALGGGMNRQDAFARRDAARTAGLPPDTYAQNFRK
jgi:hypothetical protein